ncbi:hypothetical protein KFK09_009542 [Dendrobium nobile]|uniref:Uncharacterized protein n=1 Tax=Dendrobium nobile TaxID=94219 RepID=A0A8T3BK52_DENNO|nr:hypothetical protein KFK09_009542 [Dendrobium nobile]
MHISRLLLAGGIAAMMLIFHFQAANRFCQKMYTLCFICIAISIRSLLKFVHLAMELSPQFSIDMIKVTHRHAITLLKLQNH